MVQYHQSKKKACNLTREKKNKNTKKKPHTHTHFTLILERKRSKMAIMTKKINTSPTMGSKSWTLYPYINL